VSVAAEGPPGNSFNPGREQSAYAELMEMSDCLEENFLSSILGFKRITQVMKQVLMYTHIETGSQDFPGRTAPLPGMGDKKF
jgi:hypothetical protein